MVAPLIGLVVVPEAPLYHWYVSGVVPVAATDSVAEPPALIAVDCGGVVIDGAAHGALCVIVIAFPATTTDPLRLALVVFAATVKVVAPLPLP